MDKPMHVNYFLATERPLKMKLLFPLLWLSIPTFHVSRPAHDFREFKGRFIDFNPISLLTAPYWKGTAPTQNLIYISYEKPYDAE